MKRLRLLRDALTAASPAGEGIIRRGLEGAYLHWTQAVRVPRARLADPAVVLDLETTGLTGDTPLFLVGLLARNNGDATLHQFFAPAPDREATVLRAARRLARCHGTVLTYNGSTFDLPYWRRRARRHDLEPFHPATHIDVLHLCRRAWRGQLPRFRLITVEAALNGGPRSDDLPSYQIPSHYHRFVESGDPRWVVPIFRHNADDLLTTWRAYCRIERGLGPYDA